MRAFIAFLLGLVLTAAAIAVLPIPEDSKYRSLSDDARRLDYVYRRITKSSTPIDVAFIGTSHIMGGIDDMDIERRLRDEHIDVNVANLGVIMAGRDLHLLVAKRLMQHKRPKLIVVEIDEHEPPYGHPLTPYVGDLSDMFCCRFFLDVRFPRSFLMFLKRQILNIPLIFSEKKSDSVAEAPDDFGWAPVYRTWAVQADPLAADQVSTSQKLTELGYRLTPWYGLDVVEKITALAHENNVAVAFLYIPGYQYAGRESVVNIRYYSSLGPVVVLPRDIVINRASYFDIFHLNAAAAAAVVPYLASQIKAMLVQPPAPGGGRSAGVRIGGETPSIEGH